MAASWLLRTVLLSSVLIPVYGRGTVLDSQGPVLTSQPRSTVEFSNDTGAMIHCSARGSPSPRVDWLMGDGSPVHPVPNIREMLVNGSMYFLPFGGESYRGDVHAAVYRCQASNSVGKVLGREIAVRAVVRQKYDVVVKDAFVRLGNTGVLRCEIPPNVKKHVRVTSWVQDHAFNIFPAAESDGKYHMLPTGELLIFNVNSDDKRHGYRCRTVDHVTGDTVESSTLARLFVTEHRSAEPPRFNERVSPAPVRTGETIVLFCISQGYPPPTYLWFRESVSGTDMIVNSERVHARAGVLVLQSARVEDAGRYVCHANNSAGSERVELEVSIISSLSIHLSPQQVTVDLGKNALFQCAVTGQPTPIISWAKDGLPVREGSGRTKVMGNGGSTLNIYSITRDDKGMYQCFAKNDYEMVQATAELRLGVVRMCLAGITISAFKPKTSTSSLIKSTVKVLTTCYGKEVSTVSIYGDSTGHLFKALSSKKTLPVTLIDSSSKAPHDGLLRYESPIKIHVFTIIVSSSTELQQILSKIKSSSWWNHMASFLILNWTNVSTHECLNTFDLLWVAWKMNLLDAKLLCVDPKEEVLFYTYNPYTKNAPTLWKLKATLRGKDDQPWFVFEQRYRDDEEICKKLEFDKTRDLGGYAIAASVKDMDVFWLTNLNKTGIDRFEGLEGMAAQMYFRAMNAEAKLELFGREDPYLYYNDKGESNGMMVQTINGLSDIILNSWRQELMQNITMSYPYWHSGLGVVTEHRGRISQLSKINSVLDVSSRYGLYLVLLITPICFMCFLDQAPVPAILNTFRIICNFGLPTLPRKTTTRIYLTTLFIFQITILSLYQGQLASLLTKPVFPQKPETAQDLMDQGYTIIGHKSYTRRLTDPIYGARVVPLEEYLCLEYVVRNISNACLLDWDVLNSDSRYVMMQVSKESIIKSSLAYAIREDWPLEQRFNEILARLTETDIIRHIYTTYSEKFLRVNKYYESMQKEQRFEVITLSDISFAFVLLGIGLGYATMAFIFEVGMYRIKLMLGSARTIIWMYFLK